MILVVAEKPSVGRDIARVLGCKTAGEGCLRGEKYVVTWAVGHLVSLVEPEGLDEKYKKWRMEHLPILPEKLPTRVLPKTKSQFAIVKKLMLSGEVEKIICATDSGREGELIFRYIYNQAGCKKPVDRLWISSMTAQAIKEGFASLRPDSEYDPLYVSARCRAEADWLVGMNASRAFTLKYGALLSLGRVQTPTLNLIVQRDNEIKNFVPQDYFEIRADFGAYQGLWIHPETKEARCPDEKTARQIVRQVEGQESRVAGVQREEKRMPPPLLFDLTALQREANRLMGLSAAKTLDIAQALYEKHKLITYPRTDSRCLTHDMIPKIKAMLGKMPEPYLEMAQPLLPNPPAPYRVYNDKKVSDHHAIVPTGQFTALSRLNPQEKKVFDMIARRLLASLYPDYQYESVQIFTQAAGHTFKTAGQIPRQLGWRALYQGEKQENAREEETPLPSVSEGDMGRVEKAQVKKCKTKPPAPHTDASLLGLMEHAGRMIEDETLRETMKDMGLGTPATRAAILERLIQVGYVKRAGKTLAPTEKGVKLMQVIPPELSSPETTGLWERALSRMARETDVSALDGRAQRFMESIRRFSAFLVTSAREQNTGVEFEKESRTKGGKTKSALTDLGRPCPLCGQGHVTANSKAFGCSRWKEGCAFTIWKNALSSQGGPAIGVNAMKKLLDTGKAQLGEFSLSMEKGRLSAVKAAPGAQEESHVQKS